MMMKMRVTLNCQKHLEKLIDVIRNDWVDCYICKLDSNIKYLTGDFGGGHEGFSLIVHSEGDAYMFVPKMEENRARNDVKGVKIEVLNANKAGIEVFKKIKELKSRMVAFDSLSYEDFKTVRKRLPNVKLHCRPDILLKLRQIKDEEEVKLIEAAARISDIGMDVASEALRLGMREYELAAEVEYAMRKTGCEGLAFDTNVSSGFRSSYPHGGCTDKRISKGETVVIDIGSKFKGYMSDLTRTYILGKPSSEQLKIYRAVYEAQEKALEAISDGMKGCEADSTAREVIREKGYVEYFIHGLGHGVGIDIHELPRLSPVSKDAIELKNVLTIEPGIYLPNKFGVRIEDLTLVTPKGLRLLSHAEKNIY